MKIYCVLLLLALRVDRVFSGVFEDKMPDKVPTAREWGWRDLRVSTMARYIFEGVDYDDFPEKFQYHDCQAEMERCISMIPYAYRVCAYNSMTKWYWNLYSPCQIDYLNCDWRVRNKLLKFGNNSWETPLMYEGAGYWCSNSRRLMLISEDDIEYEKGSTPDTMTTAVVPTDAGVHLNV